MSSCQVIRKAKPSFIKGDSASAVYSFSTNKWTHHKTHKKIESKTSRKVLDISWLKYASDAYDVSDNPRDYVIAEVPVVTVDIPNRNLDCFVFEEVSRWSPILGRMVYQSFIGKPTFANHDNKDPRKAKGVNFDAVLRKVGRIYKIFVLSGFDRTKDPALADKIHRQILNRFSMGAFVDTALCSVHERPVGPPPAVCCSSQKGDIVNGVLRYDICLGVNYVENSSVEDPADIFAWTPEIW